MNKDEYKKYLLSDHWLTLKTHKINQLKRKKSFFCEICLSKNKLNIHHMKYKNIYDVKITDLRCLCERCHKLSHEILNSKNPLGITSKKYSFAELKILVEEKLGYFSNIKQIKLNSDNIESRKIRSIMKKLGFKMCGLSHKSTIKIYNYLNGLT